MMTPQLFINYKLKSVAHMPWRMMTYKALNTFIDDLFAFIIKMPWLHRLACLRDGTYGLAPGPGHGAQTHTHAQTNADVIFFIYLYQRWVYPVDPKRRYVTGRVFTARCGIAGVVDERALAAACRNEYEGGDAAGAKEDGAGDDEQEDGDGDTHKDGDKDGDGDAATVVKSPAANGTSVRQRQKPAAALASPQ
jgi:hypothetical protein